MKTKANELIRIGQFAGMFVVEILSPTHGRWISIEECRTLDDANRRAVEWTK